MDITIPVYTLVFNLKLVGLAGWESGNIDMEMCNPKQALKIDSIDNISTLYPPTKYPAYNADHTMSRKLHLFFMQATNIYINDLDTPFENVNRGSLKPIILRGKKKKIHA